MFGRKCWRRLEYPLFGFCLYALQSLSGNGWLFSLRQKQTDLSVDDCLQKNLVSFSLSIIIIDTVWNCSPPREFSKCMADGQNRAFMLPRYDHNITRDFKTAHVMLFQLLLRAFQDIECDQSMWLAPYHVSAHWIPAVVRYNCSNDISQKLFFTNETGIFYFLTCWRSRSTQFLSQQK